MKIVVLAGSPHKNGTSNTLVDEFIRGAKEKGHDVSKFDVAYMNIHPCIGCNHCKQTGACVFGDDMLKLYDIILNSDMILFSSPTYYFGFSAQLKSVIDRFYSRSNKLQDKHLKSAFIVTAGNENIQNLDAISKHIEILTNYLNFDNVGTILATGYGVVGADIEKTYKEQAYNLGKDV